MMSNPNLKKKGPDGKYKVEKNSNSIKAVFEKQTIHQHKTVSYVNMEGDASGDIIVVDAEEPQKSISRTETAGSQLEDCGSPGNNAKTHKANRLKLKRKHDNLLGNSSHLNEDHKHFQSKIIKCEVDSSCMDSQKPQDRCVILEITGSAKILEECKDVRTDDKTPANSSKLCLSSNNKTKSDPPKISKVGHVDSSCDIENKKELIIMTKTISHLVETDQKISVANQEKCFLSEEKTLLKESADGAEVEEKEEFATPYYLENFKLIIDTVTSDDFYDNLFNEDDHMVVEKFRSLSEPSQKVYVRLFLRRFRWLRKNKIVYDKIAPDLTDCLQELVDSHLVLDETNLTDLEEALNVLPAPDVRILAKSLKLNLVNQQRKDLIEAILQHSKKSHIGAFFQQAKGGTATMILKRAQKAAGRCYKLETMARSAFMSLVMLFCLHQTNEENEQEQGGQQQIFQILMSNIGRLVYPTYRVNKQSKIFLERQDLLRFKCAIQMYYDIREALDHHNFSGALDIYRLAQTTMDQIWTDQDIQRHDRSLPSHLRVYTAGSVYARIATCGVEVLQKLREYGQAVDLLEKLLKQDLYHTDYRGHWYERLALNLDQHLKKQRKTLEVIGQALVDPHVQTGHRYALFQRAERLCHSPSLKKLHSLWKDFQDDLMVSVQEAPKLVIQGRRIPAAAAGIPAAWLSDGSGNEAVLYTRVEDFVLAYYRTHGFPQGIHGEGGTFTFLFGLLFWDIMFDDSVPDTFLNQYQTFPLDYHTAGFYSSRQEVIEARLEQLRDSTIEELCLLLEKSWEEHENMLCVAVNWNIFDSIHHCQGLLRCMGPKVLYEILGRMARNMRRTRGGVPDLVVWNEETLLFKVVEVKGPGDRLSTKQMLWLSYLLDRGVDALVCHVEAVPPKRL